jgi:hypothetical protein
MLELVHYWMWHWPEERELILRFILSLLPDTSFTRHLVSSFTSLPKRGYDLRSLEETQQCARALQYFLRQASQSSHFDPIRSVGSTWHESMQE